MRGKNFKWQTLDDVPQLIIEWTTSVSNETLSVDDIFELVSSYEDWLDTVQDAE